MFQTQDQKMPEFSIFGLLHCSCSMTTDAGQGVFLLAESLAPIPLYHHKSLQPILVYLVL